MRAVAAARPGQRFYIKGVPYRSFLSYDRPTHNGTAYSRLMNGVLLTSGQVGPKSPYEGIARDRLRAVSCYFLIGQSEHFIYMERRGRL